MKGQHCRLVCPIVLLLCGACIVYGYEVSTCELLENYKCVANMTGRYGFNIYSPDLLDQFPILNETVFIELCSDYISMVNCLKENRPCDHLSRRYTKYALALAKGLDYACRKDILTDYAAVFSCFQMTEVKRKYNSCQWTFKRSVQELINETVESALDSRIDINVVVEKACQFLKSSMECTADVLLLSCSIFVNDWYLKVYTEMIEPTLSDYRCQLYMPVSKIVNLFFVSLGATIIACVIIFVCIQRYKSFMRSKMNFVLSVIPKAQHTFQKFDPKRISKSMKASKTTSEVPTTTEGTSAAVAAPDASTVSQPTAIDAKTAHILQQLAHATQQIAPGQRNLEAKAEISAEAKARASAEEAKARASGRASATSATSPTTSSHSWWGWFS